jgi:adenylate cyclase
MTHDKFKRKLTTILSADVAGYSRLMGEDEAATVRTLEHYKQIMSELIRQHRGRVVDAPGDNLLAEFASVVDAVQCAVATQKELQARNAELLENRRMHFRIGVNLGDVIEEESRIYGDGVNIAARLEALADPGGICISKTAFDQIESKLPLGYEYFGEQSVKNIAKPVGVYKVLMEPRVTITADLRAGPKTGPGRGRKITLICATALVVVIGAAFAWQFILHKTSPQSEKVDLRKAVFAPPDKTSIAVLPFQNMTGDPQQEYLSDGMAEQLITALSQIPDIYVTARTSSFAYKGKSMTAQQIAGELGVRYLIEGSIQRDADRVRIHVQLIDGRNGEHIWAERYDRKFEDLFALQDQIAMEVMAAVNVKFSGFVSGSLKYSRPSNLKAYEYFLKGLHYHLGRKQQDVMQARQMLEEAIKLDPNYGAAYRWLGFVCLDEIYFRMTKSFEKSIEQAEQAAQKGWEVDPEHPPYGLMSAISRTIKDFDNAVLYAEKAVELDPNNGGIYFTVGVAYMLAGRYEESIENLETAIRLVPVKPPNYLVNLGRSYLGNKQYGKAILIFTETLERYPDFPGCYSGLTVAYELSGNHEKALWAAENLMRVSPKFSLAADEKSWPYKDEDFKKRFYDALRSAELK